MTFDIKEQLEELRAFLNEASGKLAAAASMVAGTLAFVSSDPSVALLLSEMLPGPLRFVFIAVLVAVTYVLPHWAKKKDDNSGEGI
jgi:low temperature requirement protein LtrA